jgi:hypothetical protein
MPLWGNADDKTSTGTVEIFANGLVTGTTTAFTTEAEAGDYIIADSKKFRILTITDDTTCHVAAGKLGDAVSAVSSGTNYELQEAPIYVSASRVNTDANDVFGVDTTEVGIESANVIAITITDNGSGYTANAAVTISGGGGSSATANAEANATGRIAVVNITDGGSSYETSPTVAIAAPSAISFNANTALFEEATGINANTDVDDTAEFIAISSNPFGVGDLIEYTVAAGNTAIGGLTGGEGYYVVFSNSTGIAVSTTSGGANVDLTKGLTETGHSFRREDGFIEIASNVLQVGDKVTYDVAAGNTVITGLTDGAEYYVVAANTTGVRISETNSGEALDFRVGLSETGHTFTGETATANAVIGGTQGVAHAGWVLRTVGTGGRAGRVQYETLVASSSITGDAEDDPEVPDV